MTGAAGLARAFASQSLALCRDHDLGPYLEGYAQEALARAAFVEGDEAVARAHLGHSRELAAQVDDTDDRALLEADLDELEA